MINIISDLLKLTEFIIDKENNFAINNKKRMFYVYKNYNGIKEFKEKVYEDQNKLYDYITGLENGSEIKKNTSFIVLIKLNENSEKNNIQEEILDLEEDKYFFKKYVITYINDEVNSFYNKLKEFDNIINFMEKNLNDKDKFEKFKVSNEVSYYSLILKIYIKIPHLSCGDIFSKKEIINLEDNIIEEIKEVQDKENDDTLLDYHKKIISLDENDIDRYIERMLLEIKESE
ncbi:ABC-three component system middle component 1 [Clostridium akagii]|uniref:ABC-three component system middle component 1 n=1 Tax=Clostridium akagii TaxID=91623 RepID=UPI00047D9F7F|nr:ABC-three component system middle component 1 [Clostridium akagii]